MYLFVSSSDVQNSRKFILKNYDKLINATG
jgi:hypothetical protein